MRTFRIRTVETFHEVVESVQHIGQSKVFGQLS
jgi:hypothetical protein